MDKDVRKFVVVEERAEFVRGIFRDALAGAGHQTIARDLNERRVPLFGHGNQTRKIWQVTLIRHILYAPTVVGTLVLLISEYVDGVRRLHPQTPVENYYPAVVDQDIWDALRARRQAWAEKYYVTGPKIGRSNLLAGLSRCPFCDRIMIVVGSKTPEWRDFVCRMAHAGAASCSRRNPRPPTGAARA